MIRVLYDHQKFSGQQYGGISRYFANLVAGVNANPGFEASVSMLYNRNHYINNLKFPLKNMIGRLIFGSKPSRIYKWNKQYSKYRINKNNFDLLHPTYYHPYFMKGLNKPYVLTVHDMIYEILPEHFLPGEPVMEQKNITIKNASGIIAISKSTKQDLMKILNIPAEQIEVIYHGIDTKLDTVQVSGLPQNYLLFVGERPNYKNFGRLLHCFAELRLVYPHLHLLCAGGGTFTDDELALQQTLHVNNHCIQTDAGDKQLNYLYQQAMVFVFPSLYEGFGYPLLEAFRAGCAVAASNTSSFPEVGGDAVHYFDPKDKFSMYKAIDELMQDSELRKDYIKKGYEQLKHYTLQREIEETLNFYTKLVGRK